MLYCTAEPSWKSKNKKQKTEKTCSPLRNWKEVKTVVSEILPEVFELWKRFAISYMKMVSCSRDYSQKHTEKFKNSFSLSGCNLCCCFLGGRFLLTFLMRQSVPHGGLACILCQMTCWIQNLPTTTAAAAAAAAAATTTTTLHLASSLYGRNIIPYLVRLVGRWSHCKTILMLRQLALGSLGAFEMVCMALWKHMHTISENIKAFWEMVLCFLKWCARVL